VDHDKILSLAAAILQIVPMNQVKTTQYKDSVFKKTLYLVILAAGPPPAVADQPHGGVLREVLGCRRGPVGCLQECRIPAVSRARAAVENPLQTQGCMPPLPCPHMDEQTPSSQPALLANDGEIIKKQLHAELSIGASYCGAVLRIGLSSLKSIISDHDAMPTLSASPPCAHAGLRGCGLYSGP